MTYKVCIPTAGIGSRLGELTRYLNKSLVSIANRPTICHLIEQFPTNTKFVITLGHKGYLVRDFLELAYPDHDFDYAQVDPYEGEGSGLGLSLLACKDHLQEPFIFTSCDTLVDETIPAPDRNWMGFAEVRKLKSYRTIKIGYQDVIAICEKGIGAPPTHKAYIGMAGISDYKSFWESMDAGGFEAIETGEAYGLRALLPMGIKPISFTWHDTGNIEALIETRDHYREKDGPTILDKANEAIWFVGDHVIKFSDDRKFIENRVKRVSELGTFIPEITGSSSNMYRYSKAVGKVFSEAVNLPLFEKLLEHSTKFWSLKKLVEEDLRLFHQTCLRFYKEKTYERITLFYKNFEKSDGREKINGVGVPLMKDLLDEIDWDSLSNGLPGRFHGDFHFENILWDESSQKFTFLDWRQDFGGDLHTGDIYYDFAKLQHGLIINHEIIANNLYWVEWGVQDITFNFHRKQILVECEQEFYKWLESEGYDVKKVRMLTALIYLNIAALHHQPYSLLLYALGKSMLNHELKVNK
jgi:CTP:phosphocholine cytidylyltransferase-like protein